MSGINKITRTVAPGSIFESMKALLAATVSFNQGDLLIYDTSAFTVRKPTTEAEFITFLGIARQTVVNGVIAAPYTTAVDATAAIADVPGPQYGVVAKLQLKTGDTLNPGALVYGYPTQGPRVCQASGTKAIGVYQGPAVTGGASTSATEVEVFLGHRYPADTLVF